MDKELFVETIEVLEKQYRLDAANLEHINKVFNGHFEGYDNHLVHNQIIKLLQAEYPTYPNSFCDIEYFCFELDFGKKYKEGMVTVGDKVIDFSTPEKLWEYLEGKQEELKNVH